MQLIRGHVYYIASMKENSEFPPACITFQHSEVEILKVGLEWKMRSQSSVLEVSLVEHKSEECRSYLNYNHSSESTYSLDKICIIKLVG